MKSNVDQSEQQMYKINVTTMRILRQIVVTLNKAKIRNKSFWEKGRFPPKIFKTSFIFLKEFNTFFTFGPPNFQKT